MARCSAGCGNRSRHLKTSSFLRIVTTIWAWPSLTAWRPLKAERGRSSAPSTASANAPVTRLWKKSPRSCMCAPICILCEHGLHLERLYPTSQTAGPMHQLLACSQQGHRGQQRLRARSRHSSARRAGQSADLRDHDSGICGRAPQPHGSGKALGPPRTGASA